MNKTDMAKKNLREFVNEIDAKLEKYWNSEISHNFGFNNKQKALVEKILLHSKEHNLRTAKRVRGAFTYYAYRLSGKDSDDKIWQACMALELVHTVLLMHDDFMDQDIIRRGKPTTQKYFAENADDHYGESMAVTTGDVVLCLGFELLNNCGFEPQNIQKAMKKMLRGIAETAYGQAYDVTLEKLSKDWEEEDVISVHKAKTSIYTYENPLFIGAYLADVPQDVFSILHDYSMDGGVAFQLQDDILGIFGNAEKTGKSSDSDLLQGKCTLLVMRVMSHGTNDHKNSLLKVWGKRKASRNDIDMAKKAIIESGSLDYSKKISREFAQKAASSAQKLRGRKLNPESIDFLEGIAQYMVEREL